MTRTTRRVCGPCTPRPPRATSRACGSCSKPAPIRTCGSSGGLTPLHAAAHADHEEMARLLLEHGADPTAKADDGRDAARIAADDGSTGVAALLAG